METYVNRSYACGARRSSCPTLRFAVSSTTSTPTGCARSTSKRIASAGLRSGGDGLLGCDGRADARELHRRVLEPAELEVHDVERIVLVQAPRRLRALLGELVD